MSDVSGRGRLPAGFGALQADGFVGADWHVWQGSAIDVDGDPGVRGRLRRAQPPRFQGKNGDVLRCTGDRQRFCLLAEIHLADFALPLLAFHLRPETFRRCRGTRRDKIDLDHILRQPDLAVIKERHHRRPVTTDVPPPMSGPRLFFVDEIRVKLRQFGAHLPGLLNRHIVVGITVQNIHSGVLQITAARQRIADGHWTSQHDGHSIRGLFRTAAGIGTETNPSRARADGREAVGKKRANMPCPVAAHGMTSQPCPARLGLKSLAGEFQHLQRIPSPPILPVKTKTATVGGCDHIRIRPRTVNTGLTGPFHSGPVQ